MKTKNKELITESIKELHVIAKQNDDVNSTFNSLQFAEYLARLRAAEEEDPLAEIKLMHKAKASELGLTGKAADTYIKAQLSIWEKEQRQKAEDEAKLLGTAMQQLLPDIFEEKRAIPNVFLRGALFGMVRPGKRKLVENMPIFTMSQYEVRFSGSELDQNDLEVWDTLMYLAKERNVESQLRLTLYDLCRQMKLTDSVANRKALITRIERLKFGVVKINKDKKQFGGSLINNYFIDIDGDGKLVIEYNKKLTPLFADNDYTIISADIRHLLGENQLARWLYNFYESHREPIPFAIDFIQKLCKSETEQKDFKRKIKIALAEVKKAHLSVNQKSKWDYEITEKNWLYIYPMGKNKKTKKIDLFTSF